MFPFPLTNKQTRWLINAPLRHVVYEFVGCISAPGFLKTPLLSKPYRRAEVFSHLSGSKWITQRFLNSTGRVSWLSKSDRRRSVYPAVQDPRRTHCTSWCRGGSHRLWAAAVCWASSCCGRWTSSRWGRRCRGSRCCWPADCSGEASPSGPWSTVSRLSNFGGKTRRWCIPAQDDNTVSTTRINSSVS